MLDLLNAKPLIAEYESLVLESKYADQDINWKSLEKNLSTTAEWTEESAAHLAYLARSYGAFILRNALALAVALDIEDGELGL